VLKPL